MENISLQNKEGKIETFLLLFNTYFTSVAPTAQLLHCNWPITGIRRFLLASED